MAKKNILFFVIFLFLTFVEFSQDTQNTQDSNRKQILNALDIDSPNVILQVQPNAKAIPVEIGVLWQDSWFLDTLPAQYNHNLCRVACTLSDNAYTDITQKNNVLENNLQALGFSDIFFNYDLDYNNGPLGKDQCAFSLSKKNISGKTLLCLVIRGTPGTLEEWISNLNINDNTQIQTTLHEGFAKAAYSVKQSINDYIKKYNIDINKTCILITGHSRGAAVANIIAAWAKENFLENSIYAYTFASPNATQDENANSKEYSYIWNIVNAEDVVPTVPFNRRNWKFQKYGQVLVLCNVWNTQEDMFLYDYMPKKNQFHKAFNNGRVFYPFLMGPFLPVQLSDVFTKSTENVQKYYNKNGWRTKGEKAMPALIAAMASMGQDGHADDTQVQKPLTLVDKIIGYINKKSGNLIDYAMTALYDSHDSKSYLSWLLALNQKQAFSDTGYSQLIIEGLEEGVVLGQKEKQDEKTAQGLYLRPALQEPEKSHTSVKMRIIDGKVKYSAIRRPVATRPSSVKRFIMSAPITPATSLCLYLTDESLFSTKTKVTLEHYTASGVLQSIQKTQELPLKKNTVYRLDLGQGIENATCVPATKLEKKQAKALIKEQKLDFAKNFRIRGLFSLDTDLNMEVGIQAGAQMLYGLVTADFALSKLIERFDLGVGLGMQKTLYWTWAFDAQMIAKSSWVTRHIENDDQKYNFIPEARLGFTCRPNAFNVLFVAGCFDFAIQDFNEAAFYATSRKQTLKHFKLSSKVDIYPRIIFGLRL